MLPPLQGSKKLVLKCLSNIIIVMQPARTGKEIISNKEVMNRDQAKRGRVRLEHTTDWLATLMMVTTKLMEPKRELRPVRCRENNMRSTEE
jgi:uncharacterized membrane protein